MNRYSFSLWACAFGWITTLAGASSDRLVRASASTISKTAAADRSAIATNSVVSSRSIVTYAPATAEVLNPERGFHNNIELMNDRDFSDVRRKGYTLARSYIRLDEYRNRPLPAAFLAKLDRQFQLVRAAGIKVIPRFSYNFPAGAQEMANAPDASLNLTIAHINQLKPILQRNADVIAVLQGGFIGAWGEWHSSGNQLDKSQPKAKILTALLAALPTNQIGRAHV